MRLRRRRARRMGASLLQAMAPAMSAVISLLVVAIAGVETWGAFLAALILVRLWAQVVDFGSRDYLLRAFSQEPTAIKATWARNVGARVWLLSFGPLLFVVAGWDAASVALMTVWLVMLFIGQSHSALVSYRRTFGLVVALDVASTVLTCVAVLMLGARLVAGDLLLIFSIVATLRAAVLAARFGVLGGIRSTRAVWPGLAPLREAWPFFLLSFSGAVQSRVDLYVVALLLPAPALGEYGVLTNFVLLTQSMSGALMAPVVPGLYRMGRDRVLVGAIRMVAAGVPLTLGAMVGTVVCLAVLYGIELTLPTVAAAWVATLMPFVYAPLVVLCFRDGREAVVVSASVLGIAVGLVGTALLAPTLGIAGAMLAAAAGQVSMALFHVIRVASRPMTGAGPDSDAPFRA